MKRILQKDEQEHFLVTVFKWRLGDTQMDFAIQ